MHRRSAAGEGLTASRRGAIGETQGLTAFGGDLEAAQGAVVGLLRPAQHCGATARAQALFGSPQSVASAGLQQDQVAQVDRGGQPGLRIGYVGCADQYDATLRLGQASEGRHQ